MDKNEIIDHVLRYSQENLLKTFTPGKTYINPAAPSLEPMDISMVVDATLDFWFTEWKYCRRFEKFISDATSKEFVVLVNSGSSASLVAMTAALKKYDPKRKRKYVLTCSTGFPTTVSPIYQNGYIPVYIDMNVDLTPNMNQIVDALDRLGDQIVGAIFAHTLGFPFDEGAISDLMGPDRFLISDCCDALGAMLPNGFPVGVYSDFATLSFFPSHHIMAGEGGAVLCSSPEDHRLVEGLVNWGRSCYCRPGESNTCGHRFDWSDRGDLPEGWDHKYIFDQLGYNLKMTELQGALGYSQIHRLDHLVSARRENYRYLYNELNRSDYRLYVDLLAPSQDFSPFGFPIRVDESGLAPFDAARMIAYLEEHKVGTRRLFGGNLVRQPGFMSLPYELALHNEPGMSQLNTSDHLMRSMFWISVSPSLNKSMLDYMVYTIDQFFIDVAYKKE